MRDTIIRRPHLPKRWRPRLAATVAFSLCALASATGAAQYLDPPNGGGYFDGSGPPDAGPWLPPGDEPLIRFGFGLDLGVGYGDLEPLDDSFFERNNAKDFDSFATFVLDGTLHLQIGQHFRVGLQAGNQLTGTGRNFASFGYGGLMLEGGVPLSPAVSLWLGGVFGYQGYGAQSKDPEGREFEYEAGMFFGRLQGRVEGQLTPFIALRGTLFGSVSSLLTEDFFTPRGDTVTIPAESDFNPWGVGFTLGVVFTL